MTPIENLKNKAVELNVYDIASTVLNNPRFELWSGSDSPDKHHYGKGGLCTHTNEVVELCFSSINTLGLTDIDPKEIYLSALFHDYGKCWDYVPTNNELTEWKATEHKRLVHHISRSALEWQSTLYWLGYNNTAYCTEDKVLHNILSHHGMREWGSPVMPKTKAAWLLHLCDSISARMNDANKKDFVKV